MLAPTQQNQNFLDLGRTGKSAWWRYILGFAIILALFVVGNVVCLFFWSIANGGEWIADQPTVSHSAGLNPVVAFVGMHLIVLFILIGLFLVIRFLHQRPLRSLINGDSSPNCFKFGLGFGVWSVSFLICHLLSWLTSPGSFSVSLQVPEFFYFIGLVFILTPIQCFSEELLFRGYLLQGFSSLIRNSWLGAAWNGILFLLPHLDSPLRAEPYFAIVLFFFATGFFFAIMTIRTNSIEMSVGAHTANNMVNGLIINYTDSPLVTNSIFLTSELRPWLELFTTVVAGVLTLVLASKFGMSNRNPDERIPS